VAGHHAAISLRAKGGLRLFIGRAGCVRCHNTPLFPDDDFHVIDWHIDTTLSPHADPTETGRLDRARTSNQALISNSVIADGDFNVNGPFSDDPIRSATAVSASRTFQWGLAHEGASSDRRDGRILPRRPGSYA
jgi:cytochrome c peroxidase